VELSHRFIDRKGGRDGPLKGKEEYSADHVDDRRERNEIERTGWTVEGEGIELSGQRWELKGKEEN
jgi:hypothetical protein